jgi:hypothetical protein
MKIASIVNICLVMAFLTSCSKDNVPTENTPKSTLGDGLIAFYNFNDTLLDQSGNGLSGTAYGGAYCSELGGNKSYYFNGNGDYIKVRNSPLLNPTNAVTISLWVKPIDYVGIGTEVLVEKPYTSHTSPYYQYLLGITGSYGSYPYNFTLNVSINGAYCGINTGSNTWIQGNWYHVVGLFDGNAMKLYVNGELRKSLDSPGSIPSYNTDLFMGKHANLSNSTEVTLDNVRIYRRALSEKEIQELYTKEFK